MHVGALVTRLRRAALAALTLPWLAGCVEGLFFHPDARTWSTPRELGVVAVDVSIAGADGVTLHGWWLPASGAAKGSVLHLHGNAANVSNHLPLVAWLPRAGWNVLMLDYRGFGKSAGTPSLDGVVADGAAALAWLRARRDIDPARLVVLGQSLGGATALRLAAGDDRSPALHALVVEGAFASYCGIARDAAGALGWLAAPLLATLPGDAADPLAAARRLRVPLLVIHGSADRVIPIGHGQALFDAASSPARQWLRIDGGEHLDSLLRDDVQRRLLAWLDQPS